MTNFISEKEALAKIGFALKKFRLAHNFTQKEVAKKTGIDRATVSTIENGNPTTLVYIVRLLYVYDKLDEFLNFFYIPEVSPMELYRLDKKRRKYASHKKS